MNRLAALLAGGALALAGLAAHPARAETACADLASLSLAHAKVTAASVESLGQAQACKLEVTSTPTADSDIHIEVWIPLGAAWNGGFVQLGNGGFAGQIPSAQLKAVAARGYAAAGTDDGHQSTNLTDASWALGHPQKVVDFAWRALKQTTDTAKALIAAQKGAGAARSYFYGCSDGGREALMEAQRFPTDFNGIIAGAPAYDMSDLFGEGAAIQQALARPGGYLGQDQRALLQSAALAQCGGGDFIRDPAACRFDPAALACKPGQEPARCLTPAQLATTQVIYGGFRDPRTGKLESPGFSPGAEAQPGSWALWTTGPSEDKRQTALNYMFSSNAFKYFAFGDAAFDMMKLDLGAQFQQGLKNTRVLDSIDPDLKAFRDHGGKLINYHGWNDPAIPAKASIAYYERMAQATGAAESFYRLYLVPGMLHCGGGPGPGNVDWLAVLEGWVKTGQAPGELTATGPAGASQKLTPYRAGSVSTR